MNWKVFSLVSIVFGFLATNVSGDDANTEALKAFRELLPSFGPLPDGSFPPIPVFSKKLGVDKFPKYSDVRKVLLERGFVDFVADRESEIFALKLSEKERREIGTTVNEFRKELSKISLLETEIENAPEDLRPGLQKALLEHVKSFRQKSDDEVIAWCRKHLDQDEFYSLVSAFLKFQGFLGICCAPVFTELKINDNQLGKIRTIGLKGREYVSKKYRELGLEAVRKNVVVRDQMTAYDAELFNILDEEQAVSYLRMKGEIGSDETTADWLRAMPSDQREICLKVSENLRNTLFVQQPKK